MQNDRDEAVRFTKKLAIAAAGVPLAAAPVAEAADTALARVFLKDGSPSHIGGNTAIIGTNAAEDVTLRDQPGHVEFDASFNRGNDTIRLPGNADGYTVQQAGSRALLTYGERSYSIPVGEVGISLVFGDGTRKLAFRTAGNAMFLGDQQITDTGAPVIAPAG